MADLMVPALVLVPPEEDETPQSTAEPETAADKPQDENKLETPDENGDRDEGTESVPNGGLAAGERPTLTRKRGFKRQGENSRMLQPVEMDFVQSIRRGDVTRVEASMEADPDLHRLEDHYGVSALEHAVLSGSIEMVEKLLGKCVTNLEKQQAIERAMLFTIKENDLILMERLIDMHQDIGACKAHNRRLMGSDSSDNVPMTDTNDVSLQMRKGLMTSPSLDLFNEDAEFSQDIKPIVLAAQLDRTEIIEMIHTRCCPEIHPLTKKNCLDPTDCLVCHHRVGFMGSQSIEECRQAIDVYKALSSPAYLFHSGGDDPLLEAFVISDQMEKRRIVDPAYRAQYEDISQRCQTFASTLLSLCRSFDEVHLLFGETRGIDWTHRTQFHQARFPRLLLAIHFNQKEFVAHPHCQQVMQNEWYRGLPNWVCQLHFHHLRLAVYTFLLFVFMPIIFIFYHFRIPFLDGFVKPAANKFIFDMCSYIYFLIMLFMKVSLRWSPERGKGLSVLDCFIFVWVIGLTVRYAKMCTRRRDRCNFYGLNAENSNWRFFEMITLVCFWLQYLLLFGLMVYVNTTGEDIQERKNLDGLDAYLWSEVFAAVACTLTVVQVFSYFKVSSTLGPLQVSLKKMIFDVMKFIILFLVVLSAFAMGLASLYSGYENLEVFDSDTHESITQTSAFTSLQHAYKRLFWDLFNYGNEENADLVIGNGGVATMVDVAGNGTLRSHRMTEIIGYIMYGTYHITVIVVLLNMLIAMMANSYNNIEANADKEWKFARTRLFMNYFNEIGVLCPPFNLLPLRALLACMGRTFRRCRVFERKETRPKPRDTRVLMDRLRKRYWKLKVAREKSKKLSSFYVPTEIDLASLKTKDSKTKPAKQTLRLHDQSWRTSIDL